MAGRLASALLGAAGAVVAAVLVAAICWPLLLLLLLLDLLWWPVAASGRRRPAPAPRNVTAASIVIVSWDGVHFLEQLLPSVAAAVREHGGDHEIIVVDNGSTDGTADWLRLQWPLVKIVTLPENRFFVRGIAAGVAVASKDVLVFLNNDMVVQPGFLRPLLDGLRDPAVFGVSAEVLFQDASKRREETGRTRGEIRGGWLKLAHVLPSRDERELDYVPTFWAGGGSSAFDRRSYLALGGFDLLYDPFYLEDTGLSYQAWKRGHQLLFTSRARVLHAHRGTSRRKFGDDYVDAMIRRNQHLFLWRNITDPRWTIAVLGLQPLSLLLRARQRGARGVWFELRALLRALRRLPAALTGRCHDRAFAVRTDRQVVAQANAIAGFRASNAVALGRLPAGTSPAGPHGAGRRLLVLSARLPRRDHDGSWVLFERLLQQAQRHRITLFAFVDTPDEAAHAEALRQHGIEVVTAVRERNPLPGNLHHRVPWRLWRDYSAPAMAQAAVRMLESTDFELVQVEYVEMAHLLAAELRARRLLAVYTCHESLAVACRREWQTRGGAGRWFGWAQALPYELRLLRPFARVVALSAADAALLRAHAPRLAIEVVPSGIDVARFAVPAPVADAPATILFVGHYQHPPNADAAQWLVREILPLVRAQVPAARVDLLGGGAPPSVEALASDGEVTVRGFVTDLAGALAAATVVAMPLRTGGGLRGKVLEAWAAGKAVVATAVAIEGLQARAGEHCLVAGDATAFAAALVRCLQDRELRRRLGAAGRALVQQQYSVAAAVGRYDALYDALLGGRR